MRRSSNRYLKITIELTHRQIAAIDGVTVEIRTGHHVVVTRSDFIQALIDAAEQRGISPDDFDSFGYRRDLP
jgi:hypothetical protein